MKYKVGDKVRVRGDLKVGKRYDARGFVNLMTEYRGKTARVAEVLYNAYKLDIDGGTFGWTDAMLRPVAFKIWCETEEEKQAVLEELEKEGYVWINSGEKPTEWNGVYDAPMCFSVSNGEFSQFSQFFQLVNRKWIEKDKPELTPSEFTRIDFSEKIIISKIPTGATVTYGDKTVTTEGEFEDASRQALAEVLCPFKVGDKVKVTRNNFIGVVKKVDIYNQVTIKCENCEITEFIGELEPYTESYNAKLFCIKGSDMYKVFEEGHIYKIIDGKFNGEGRRYDSLEDINRIFFAQFMEVKGGLDE